MKKKLFGIVSWGIGCANGVGIFARVGFYQNWINKMINATEISESEELHDDTTIEAETTIVYS